MSENATAVEKKMVYPWSQIVEADQNGTTTKTHPKQVKKTSFITVECPSSSKAVIVSVFGAPKTFLCDVECVIFDIWKNITFSIQLAKLKLK